MVDTVGSTLGMSMRELLHCADWGVGGGGRESHPKREQHHSKGNQDSELQGSR